MAVYGLPPIIVPQVESLSLTGDIFRNPDFNIDNLLDLRPDKLFGLNSDYDICDRSSRPGL